MPVFLVSGKLFRPVGLLERARGIASECRPDLENQKPEESQLSRDQDVFFVFCFLPPQTFSLFGQATVMAPAPSKRMRFPVPLISAPKLFFFFFFFFFFDLVR